MSLNEIVTKIKINLNIFFLKIIIYHLLISPTNNNKEQKNKRVMIDIYKDVKRKKRKRNNISKIFLY